MSGASDFFKTVFVFLFVIGVAWWVGTVWKAVGEDKLMQACRPMEFLTDGVHQIATALLGQAPEVTVKAQSYVMSQCYYGFSLVLPKSAQEGGIR